MNVTDIELARAEILKKAVSFFKKMPDVNGIFLAGSLPTEHFDAFSDIDLRIVVNHQQLSSVIAGKREYPQHFGVLLFNEYDKDVNHICVSHFKPFNKLDIVYLKDNELVPDYWYSLPIKIYYDPLGVINACLETSRSISWECPFSIKAEAINISVNKSIAYLFEVQRKLKRRDVNAAKDLLITVLHSYIKGLLDLNRKNEVIARFYTLTGEFIINNDLHLSFVIFKKIASEIHQIIIDLDTQFALGRNAENDNYCLMNTLSEDS
jgi:predicted nucleotidyltransferase